MFLPTVLASAGEDTTVTPPPAPAKTSTSVMLIQKFVVLGNVQILKEVTIVSVIRDSKQLSKDVKLGIEIIRTKFLH